MDLTLLAFIAAVLSLGCMGYVFLAVSLGVIGIVFAVMAKKETKYHKLRTASLVISVVGIVVSVIMGGYSTYTTYQNYQLQQQYYESMYNTGSEELIVEPEVPEVEEVTGGETEESVFDELAE